MAALHSALGEFRAACWQLARTRGTYEPCRSCGDPVHAVWLARTAALLQKTPEPPFDALLARWPEGVAYRSTSFPAPSWMRKRLGWRRRLTLIALDDGDAAVTLEEQPSWWPRWPVKATVTIFLRRDEVPDLRQGA
jgi:hypothetical protein